MHPKASRAHGKDKVHTPAGGPSSMQHPDACGGCAAIAAGSARVDDTVGTPGQIVIQRVGRIQG